MVCLLTTIIRYPKLVKGGACREHKSWYVSLVNHMKRMLVISKVIGSQICSCSSPCINQIGGSNVLTWVEQVSCNTETRCPSLLDRPQRSFHCLSQKYLFSVQIWIHSNIWSVIAKRERENNTASLLFLNSVSVII